MVWWELWTRLEWFYHWMTSKTWKWIGQFFGQTPRNVKNVFVFLFHNFSFTFNTFKPKRFFTALTFTSFNLPNFSRRKSVNKALELKTIQFTHPWTKLKLTISKFFNTFESKACSDFRRLKTAQNRNKLNTRTWKEYILAQHN